MPTIADAITSTKRLLNSNTRTELDALAAGITAVESPITLKHETDGIRAGSYISVSTKNGTTKLPETMYVHSRNGESVYVERGMDGSTALAWDADTTLIEVEPRFTGHQIHQALINSINALPENLFAVATVAVDFSTSVSAADVTFANNSFTQILSATRTAHAGGDRRLGFNVTVQEYPVGTFKLVRREGIEKAITVNLTYAHPFLVAAGLPLSNDLVNDLGMSSEMTDIPTLGAASALMLAEESTRLDLHAAGDSRGDGALNPGDRSRYSMILQAQYDRRVSQEARRLMAKWGVRTDAATSSVFPTTIRRTNVRI